jgi:hypothetical protein
MRWRVFYALVVTVLTVLAFMVIAVFESEWQSGKLSDYVALLLSPESSWVFFPLIGYSSISMLLLLESPVKQAQVFWIRLGIYTGFLLALQFSILALIGVDDTAFIVLIAWISPLVAWPILRWIAGKIGTKWIVLIVSIGALLIFLFYLLVYALRNHSLPPDYGFIYPLMFLIGGIIASAPFWALLIMGVTGFRLLKHYETKFTLPRGLGILAWMGGFTAAWSIAIPRMFQLYAQLPPQPPDCYIATAAANGHARFVGSREVTLASGTRMRVNAQLQRLKCAELALKAVAPRLHVLLRKMYDALGRPIARRMTNPFVADVAYLLLKPFEWLAVLVLPEINILARKIYG